MTSSNILEHWASIYKPLSHNPESGRLEDQSFFRVRYIDLENIFSRNANIVHSPCMLYSVLTTGELVDAKKASVSHQVFGQSKRHTADSWPLRWQQDRAYSQRPHRLLQRPHSLAYRGEAYRLLSRHQAQFCRRCRSDGRTAKHRHQFHLLRFGGRHLCRAMARGGLGLEEPTTALQLRMWQQRQVYRAGRGNLG